MKQSVSVPIPLAIRTCDPSATGTWVYVYWDRDGVLLYVGITVDPKARAVWHRWCAPWWRFVATADLWLRTDAGARSLERDLIRTFEPLFNVTHSWVPYESTIEYLAHREAWPLVDSYLERSGLAEAEVAA